MGYMWSLINMKQPNKCRIHGAIQICYATDNEMVKSIVCYAVWKLKKAFYEFDESCSLMIILVVDDMMGDVLIIMAEDDAAWIVILGQMPVGITIRI